MQAFHKQTARSRGKQIQLRSEAGPSGKDGPWPAGSSPNRLALTPRDLTLSVPKLPDYR
jgi:hypothetical protein